MLEQLLIELTPKFAEYWSSEDIYREDNGTFTPHDLMASFLMFYQTYYEQISTLEVSTLCIEFEKIVANDSGDNDSNANAICTNFLELLVDTEPGLKIEPYLGKTCKEFWSCFKF